MKKHEGIIVGLFGTCDNIRWRDPFMERFEKLGIQYFNPMVDDWHAGLIEEENWMLNNAEIILFPILAESLGSGSLGEIGFSVQNVIRNINNGKRQFLIALIDDDCTDMRKTQVERDRSIKDRKLVKSKLKEKVSCPIITLVETLDDMMEVTIDLNNFLSKGCPAEETGNKTGTND